MSDIVFKKDMQYSLLSQESNFERKFLGEFINTYYDNFIKESIPFSVYLVEILAFLCNMLSVNRVVLKDLEKKNLVVCNCYSFGFLKSGGGKSSTFGNLSDLFYSVEDAMNVKFEVMKIKMIENLQKEGHNSAKFKQLESEIYKLMVYIEEIGDFTRAGIRRLNEAYKNFKTPTGGVFVRIDEFTGFLKKTEKNGNTEECIDLMFSLYDNGCAGGTLLKNESFGKILFLPINMVALTHLVVLRSNPRLFNLFMSKLMEGMARRAIFAFPLEEGKKKIYDIDNMIIDEPDANNELLEKMKHTVKNIIDNSESKRILNFSEKATEMYFKYKEYCEERAAKISVIDTALRAEMVGRYWKAFKIAPVFHALNTGLSNSTIELESFLQAVYVMEYLGFHFERLLEVESETDIEVLFSIIKDKTMSIHEIIKHKYFKKIELKGRLGANFILESVGILDSYAQSEGYKLIKNKDKISILQTEVNEI